MKRRIPLALLILALAGIALRLRPGPESPAGPGTRPAEVPEAAAHPGPDSPPRAVTPLPVVEQASSLNDPSRTAEDDLETLDFLLSQYRRHHGGNPVGENVEITAALLGSNPKSLGYLPETGPFLDPEGRLVDRWGTPYFFHALSSERMEIRSAGADRELWSGDDLVH